MFVFFKGRLPISLAFRLMPLEAVNCFAFASQKFSAEDVISRLEVTYSEDEIHREKQKLLFQDVLPSILRDWANIKDLTDWAIEKNAGGDWSLLHCFVKFCTGQSYLPHPSQKFKITVLFDVKLAENDFPECHTCENMIEIPVQAYHANREDFEQKLKESVAHCNKFLMN